MPVRFPGGVKQAIFSSLQATLVKVAGTRENSHRKRQPSSEKRSDTPEKHHCDRGKNVRCLGPFAGGLLACNGEPSERELDTTVSRRESLDSSGTAIPKNGETMGEARVSVQKC